MPLALYILLWGTSWGLSFVTYTTPQLLTNSSMVSGYSSNYNSIPAKEIR